MAGTPVLVTGQRDLILVVDGYFGTPCPVVGRIFFVGDSPSAGLIPVASPRVLSVPE